MEFEAAYGTSRLSLELQVAINSESGQRNFDTLLLFRHWAHHTFVGAQGLPTLIVPTILCGETIPL